MTDPYEDELSIEQELEEQGREMGHSDPGTRSPLADVESFFEQFGDE